MGAIEVHRVVSQPRQTDDVAAACTHRLLIRPIGRAHRSIDATEAMTRAIAHCLWEQVGGNDALNWLEAERLVQELLSRVSSGAAVEDSSSRPNRPRARMTIEPKDGVAGRIGVDADSPACQVA